MTWIGDVLFIFFFGVVPMVALMALALWLLPITLDAITGANRTPAASPREGE